MNFRVLVSAGVLVVATIAIVVARTPSPPAESTAVAQRPKAPAAASAPQAVARVAEHSLAGAATAADGPLTGSALAAELQNAADLLPLFRGLLERANHGDAEATYYLVKVHQACRDHLIVDSWFQWGLIRAADAAISVERPADAYRQWPREWMEPLQRRKMKRCPAELRAMLSGQDPATWLETAADGGYATAQAVLGAGLLLERESADDVGRARAYLRSAVRSRDPEALAAIGLGMEMLSLLPESEREVQHRAAAWLLLARWHGLDCGPDSDRVRGYYCAYETASRCVPGAGLEDYLQISDPANYAAAAALANQLMQAMIDGRWEDLGL